MSSSASSADLLRVLVSVLLPPLGVFLQEGIGTQFWINVLLPLMGSLPGLVHAIWMIARR
ncbi:MAG: YqaE/Pmp3 family membrane protein [Bacteroidetes bacterium QH_2_63_10]|nr:MAG: YqaE/Pmp3 family membrane protein [Bacteroidetes bacterium QH_2_63_10]